MSSSASRPAPRARDSWSGQTGFLLAAIGSAIGLGNIWRFPGVSYSNGGGAFLVPYLVALIFVGIPMLWLDYAVGHKFRGSPPWALRKILGGGEFIGWFQTFVCFVIMVYYGAVLAWGVQYTIYSVNAAWGDDPTTFFTDTFLQVVPGDTFSWAPAWAVMIPLALVWILVLFVIGRGLSKGVEAANKIFLPLLVILFLALVIRALFLPGAVEGLNAFFTPNWAALADPKVWLAAFAQIFYSLSVGFGIMLTYASYLQRKSNLTGTALVAGFANSSFEILAGIGVFSAVGFMAHQGGVSVSEVEGLTGPILSFVTFPKIISMMPGGPIFGVLFFSSLVLAGVTSLLGSRPGRPRDRHFPGAFRHALGPEQPRHRRQLHQLDRRRVLGDHVRGPVCGDRPPPRSAARPPQLGVQREGPQALGAPRRHRHPDRPLRHDGDVDRRPADEWLREVPHELRADLRLGFRGDRRARLPDPHVHPVEAPPGGRPGDGRSDPR